MRRLKSYRKREAGLLKRHGLTVESYSQLLASQGGKCAICGRRPARQHLHVDHDHKTGEIRGLLCFRCNVNLGWVENYLPKIVAYLKRYR